MHGLVRQFRGKLGVGAIERCERPGAEIQARRRVTQILWQPAGPRVKLQRLFDLTSSPEGLAVELAVRDWSRRDSDVAKRLRRVDNRRIGYIRSLFSQFCADRNDVEVRRG